MTNNWNDPKRLTCDLARVRCRPGQVLPRGADDPSGDARGQRAERLDGDADAVADLEGRRLLRAATSPQLGQTPAASGGAGGEEVTGLHDGVPRGVGDHLREGPAHVREPVVADQRVVDR